MVTELDSCYSVGLPCFGYHTKRVTEATIKAILSTEELRTALPILRFDWEKLFLPNMKYNQNKTKFPYSGTLVTGFPLYFI